MTINDNTIKQIEQALQHGGLYVDPSLEKQIPVPMQVRIREAIAHQQTPVYVIAIAIPDADPNYHGSADLLAGTIHSDLGGDGTYFITKLNYDKSVGYKAFGSSDMDGFNVTYVAHQLHPDDLGAQLLFTTQNYGKPGIEAQANKFLAQGRTKSQSEQPAPPHHGDGPSPALWGGGLIALLVIAAVVVKRRRRTQVPALSSAMTTNRPFALPASVLTGIAETRDRDRERTTDAEVLALGEAIGAATMGKGADEAWQAALDQYDLARRIMQRKHSPADTVGALVLARRGRAALEAAEAGKSWTPDPSCYFNPLHASGANTVTWRGERGTVAVPACSPCAAAIKAGTEPDDVLDFADHRGRKHYFDLDLGVWSQTGYGSLDVDLVTRLFATG